ncbi:hypothetical protein [Clostridium ihumii]|uniref:hypothetical protein n=1 Tax=Clostridium ihumii TaxID=1470356 RepID=UPI000ADDD5E8|nr:hypothetical protein [Clostridium ihumii]
MGIPQIIIIVLLCLSLGMSLAKHGEERTDKYNFLTSLVATGIEVAILIWGGFFS